MTTETDEKSSPPERKPSIAIQKAKQRVYPWDRRFGGDGKPPADLMAAARALWEGVPAASIASVAAELDLPEHGLKVAKKAQGWVKVHTRTPGMSLRAHALADKYADEAAAATRVVGASAPPAEVAEVASSVLAENFAVDVRGKLIERHRTEWAAPRKLAYEAIQSSAMAGADPVAVFEKAKLAKITAETLTLIQSGELRAYGMKPGDIDASTVVIERGNE